MIINMPSEHLRFEIWPDADVVFDFSPEAAPLRVSDSQSRREPPFRPFNITKREQVPTTCVSSESGVRNGVLQRHAGLPTGLQLKSPSHRVLWSSVRRPSPSYGRGSSSSCKNVLFRTSFPV